MTTINRCIPVAEDDLKAMLHAKFIDGVSVGMSACALIATIWLLVTL